jgi:membrane fusion protein, heavy metal efflux system
VSSRHVLPEVVVFAQESEIPHAEGEEEGGGIAFLKEQQWQIGWEVVPAREDTVQNTTLAPGEIVAPDGALVEISSSVDGIADAARTATHRRSARRCAPARCSSCCRRRRRTAGSRRRVHGWSGWSERSRATSGSTPQERSRSAGSRRRGTTSRSRAQRSTRWVAAVGGDYRLRLTSPISGVVARRSFVPGGRVSAGTPLFTIVDPRTAWLRVQVPAQAAAGIPRDARATFTTDGSQQVRTTSRLVSVGNVLDPRTRTVPVVFEVTDAGGLFTFGQLAQVAVPTGGNVTGVVIPNEAIVDDNGTPVAYVQVGGETFERRVLSLGASDAGALTSSRASGPARWS